MNKYAAEQQFTHATISCCRGSGLGGVTSFIAQTSQKWLTVVMRLSYAGCVGCMDRYVGREKRDGNNQTTWLLGF